MDSLNKKTEEIKPKLTRVSKEKEIFQKMDWDLHFSEEAHNLDKNSSLKVDSSFHKQPPSSSDSPSTDFSVYAVFKWSGEGNKVYLSGSYDDWKTKLPMVKSGNDWFIVQEVPQGSHRYKYQVDDKWKVHKNEPIVRDDQGQECNLVTVTKYDCDVFAALTKDDIRSSGLIFASNSNNGWTQEVPPRGTGYTFMRSGPPLLPPHLNSTILNSETIARCDPNILVQPTHVILNHLYTLSIKDGVLVLGTTYRFRKKYITAVLYKPI